VPSALSSTIAGYESSPHACMRPKAESSTTGVSTPSQSTRPRVVPSESSETRTMPTLSRDRAASRNVRACVPWTHEHHRRMAAGRPRSPSVENAPPSTSSPVQPGAWRPTARTSLPGRKTDAAGSVDGDAGSVAVGLSVGPGAMALAVGSARPRCGRGCCDPTATIPATIAPSRMMASTIHARRVVSRRTTPSRDIVHPPERPPDRNPASVASSANARSA
jgi:hypothetical protein